MTRDRQFGASLPTTPAEKETRHILEPLGFQNRPEAIWLTRGSQNTLGQTRWIPVTICPRTLIWTLRHSQPYYRPEFCRIVWRWLKRKAARKNNTYLSSFCRGTTHGFLQNVPNMNQPSCTSKIAAVLIHLATGPRSTGHMYKPSHVLCGLHDMYVIVKKHLYINLHF